MTPVNETNTTLDFDFSSNLTWSSAAINIIIGIAGLIVTTVVLYTFLVHAKFRSHPQAILLLNLTITDLVKVLAVFFVQVPMQLHPGYLGGSRADAAIDVQWILTCSVLLTWFTYFRYQAVIKRRFSRVENSFMSTTGLITITWLAGISSFIVALFRDKVSTVAWSPCIHDTLLNSTYNIIADSFFLGVYGIFLTVAVILQIKVFLRFCCLRFNADLTKSFTINALNHKRVQLEKGVSKMCLCLFATKGISTLPKIIYTVCYTIQPSWANPHVCVFTDALHNLTCVTTPSIYFLSSSKFRQSTESALKKLLLHCCCKKSVMQVAPDGGDNSGSNSNSLNNTGQAVNEVSLEQLSVGGERGRLPTYNVHDILNFMVPRDREFNTQSSGHTSPTNQARYLLNELQLCGYQSSGRNLPG